MKNISIYRVNAVLLLGILTVVALYYGKPFFIPLFFAIALSMLMVPVSNWLEARGVGRIWATLLCILIILLFIAGIILVISLQAASFSKDLPQIQQQLQQTLDNLQDWIQQKYGVAPEQQVQFAKEQISKISQSANQFLTSVVGGFFGLLTSFALVILYFFFLMWKRETYEQFFLRVFSSESKPATRETLQQITKVSGQYLIGRLISMIFLAVCYGIGFSILGLKNALLISIIAVLPTLVPYVGAFVGGAFPILMAFVSGSTGMILPVIIILVAAQVIDNNIIEPLVMGNKLNIKPIMTIFAIVLGELIWGIPGMILFEPLFAVIRIVCAHVPKLHPYSFLIEDDQDEMKWLEKVKSVLRK
ncbi:AI-2E family transporter [Pontibacter sp. SGAir0037]|uniref:AI-2E family transporter n=1 Tax=Pontibacter sp. SGAir0037 TaxID=2571030 RepID=UPI0010CCFE2B|nr:AI-2E family transporter [Pontibacter sp. SGAir0037]QCR21886.1 AI-2E family transporter [Pontibacter sp. SGAir0037]